MRATLDSIQLEILWSSLISTVTEQARALQRVAFSPIVREAGDLGTALFDARARVVAQTVAGTPGHINSLAAAGATMAGRFAGNLHPGDVIITNDPWFRCRLCVPPQNRTIGSGPVTNR